MPDVSTRVISCPPLGGPPHNSLGNVRSPNFSNFRRKYSPGHAQESGWSLCLRPAPTASFLFFSKGGTICDLRAAIHAPAHVDTTSRFITSTEPRMLLCRSGESKSGEEANVLNQLYSRPSPPARTPPLFPASRFARSGPKVSSQPLLPCAPPYLVRY